MSSSFADEHARAHAVQLGDLSIPIAHRAGLLTMKRAAGRPQDLADVRLLNRSATSPDEKPASVARMDCGPALPAEPP